MKLAKIILMPAVCLSLCSCGTANVVEAAFTPVSVAYRTLDCFDYKNNQDCIFLDKSEKKSGKRYRVPAYSKPYKPQKLMKPGRLYGDVRSGW